MTAKEWFSDEYQLEVYSRKLTIEEKGVEFAKYHVMEALRQASEDDEADVGAYGEFGGIKRDSILNAYPLENIK